MKEFSGYIIITVLYLLAIAYLQIQNKKNKQPSELIKPGTDVIAVPRGVVINIIENRDGIDYREYADLSFNINDILNKQNVTTPTNMMSESKKYTFNNIDFSEYLPINI